MLGGRLIKRILLSIFTARESAEEKISKISKRLDLGEKSSFNYYHRGLLFLEIAKPEDALRDFIRAVKINKGLIKKCKMACGKYHPILDEKFMSSLFYEVDSNQVRPFIKNKK